jgi:maltose O-acetyltransferase
MSLRRNLRYDWPLHFVLVALNWLPDNVVILRLRGRLARPFFASCGRQTGIAKNVSFHNPSEIRIGDSVYFAHGSVVIANSGVTIGDEVMLGPYSVLASGNHTMLDGSYRFGAPALAPIVIGRGSWIGAHVTITAGSTIGEGVAVAAGAVVHGAIPPFTVAGGVPARVLKDADKTRATE